MEIEQLVTKDSLTALLQNEKIRMHVIGRALVILFKDQTRSEQQINSTNEDNGVGFTHSDARSGSISAKYYIKHGMLEDWMVERWMTPNRRDVPRIAKYHAQLNYAANVRKNEKAAA